MKSTKNGERSMIDPVMEPVRYDAEIVGTDPFTRTLGISVDGVRDSYARVSLAIKDEHCNSEVRAHGSVLFAVAATSRGNKAFSLETETNCVRGVKPGAIVVAETTLLDIRKRVSLWNIG